MYYHRSAARNFCLIGIFSIFSSLLALLIGVQTGFPSKNRIATMKSFKSGTNLFGNYEKIYSKQLNVGCSQSLSSIPMIYSSRNNQQIALFDQNANPFIVLVSHIKIAAAVKACSRFWIVVNMLFKEHFHLFLIFWKFFSRNGYFVLKVVILIFHDFLQRSAVFLAFSVKLEKFASKR